MQRPLQHMLLVPLILTSTASAYGQTIDLAMRRQIDQATQRCLQTLSVKNRLDEVKFRCFPVKRTLRRQECSPRRSGGERTVYLSCSTKRFPPSCCFASRRQRSNETDAGRPVQRKLLAAGPANHTGGSRNRHGGDW